MTLGSLMLTLVTAYLVLIAYGVVGARRRLAGRARLVASALMVALPPVLIAGALALADEGALVREWWRLFVLMLLVGGVIALLADRIARRVAP